MNPLRLVILAGLCYLLYRLLFSGKKEAAQHRQNINMPPRQSQDILVQDTICNTYIPKGQAISLQAENETMYFCSEKCRDTFLEAPKKDQQ